MKEKNLELERLVFFSDAIVAIAITILVFNLKVTGDDDRRFTFAYLLQAWPKFLAFFLSFFIIALFWKLHHQFYFYIRAIDDKLLWNNIGWLLFVVLLPFSTTLISMSCVQCRHDQFAHSACGGLFLSGRRIHSSCRQVSQHSLGRTFV